MLNNKFASAKMHYLEPYYNWLHLYNSTEDKHSPFYEKEHSEFYFSDKIYNYLIHPQWDNMGSNTLFIKILFVEYDEQFAIIEMIGEWNDCIESDIKTLMHEIIEPFQVEGINKFIIIGENVLNFFGDTDDYYQEWEDNNEDGWVVLVNFQAHVLQEMSDSNIDQYWIWGGALDDIDWRKHDPFSLYAHIDKILNHRLG